MLKIVATNHLDSPNDTLRDLARIADTLCLIFIDDKNPPELGADTTLGMYSLLDAMAGGIRDAVDRIEKQSEDLVTIPEMKIFRGKKQKYSIAHTN